LGGNCRRKGDGGEEEVVAEGRRDPVTEVDVMTRRARGTGGSQMKNDLSECWK
jgi:hypothetical protein